jgi:hypothetical protein
MRLGPSFAVLVTLGWNNPGFTLEVDFGPSGADHLIRPPPRDCKGSASRPNADRRRTNAPHEGGGRAFKVVPR